MEKKENNFEESLGDIGEREAIGRLIAGLPSKLFIGPGDDCGAIELDDSLLLLTTDTKCDSKHFPDGFAPFDKGWTIAAANLSDIAAMGGVPIGFLIAYCLPRDTPYRVLKEMQAGLDACLVEHSVPLVGGDTKEGPTLTLTGTAVGTVRKDEILTRKGARPGDIMCVTNPLGGAAAGLKSIVEKLGLEAAEMKFKRPSPRIPEGRIIAQSHSATSCTDISDGLSSSLHELSRASGYGFEVDFDSIPLHESVASMNIPEVEKVAMALSSGDEYELLFTVRLDSLDSLIKTYDEAIDSPFRAIGRVVEKRGAFLVRGNEREHIPDSGYEHFRHQ